MKHEEGAGGHASRDRRVAPGPPGLGVTAPSSSVGPVPMRRLAVRPTAMCHVDQSGANPAARAATGRKGPVVPTTPQAIDGMGGGAGGSAGLDGARGCLVLVRTVAERQVVVGACPAARGAGVRAGMALAQARALCGVGRLAHAEHDPAGDARALEGLGRWLIGRFGPVVQCGVGDPAGGVGVFVDITGTGRLLGPAREVAGKVGRALARLGVAARVAGAPTPGAAWALTFAAEDLEVPDKMRHRGTEAQSPAQRKQPGPSETTSVSPCLRGVSGGPVSLETPRVVERAADLPAALAGVPVEGLRVDAVTLGALRHLGVETIGQVMKLPRELLPARFGPGLGWRVDQAVGRAPEPLAPLAWAAPVGAGAEFDGVVDSVEALWAAWREVIERVVGQLAARGAGARRVVLTMARPDAPAVERAIELSGPCRDPRALFDLVRCAMDAVGQTSRGGKRGGGRRFRVREEGDGAEGARGDAGRNPRCEHRGPSGAGHGRHLDRTGFVPDGFTGLRMAVPVYERVVDAQGTLIGRGADGADRAAFDRLVERLRVRLGEGGGLVGVEAVESHVPERAYRLEGGSRIADRGSRIGQEGRGARRRVEARAPPRGKADQDVPVREVGHRPLRLLAVPAEVAVIVRPSDDRDGAPVAFTWGGRHRRIAQAVGPERIAGAWWLGRDKTRDYFDVAEEDGRRWWVFRVVETGKWYVHGEFE